MGRAPKRARDRRLPVRAGQAPWQLWLSYQRYALLLAAVAIAPLALVALLPSLGLVTALTPTWWLALLAAVVAGAPVARFAVQVAARWPDKLRATRVADARRARGRFVPESVGRLCTDPCFRVVAHELLLRAGLSRRERVALVARLSREQYAAAHETLTWDATTGELLRHDGDRVVRERWSPEAAGPAIAER